MSRIFSKEEIGLHIAFQIRNIKTKQALSKEDYQDFVQWNAYQKEFIKRSDQGDGSAHNQGTVVTKLEMQDCDKA